jgi:hypothetical protein
MTRDIMITSNGRNWIFYVRETREVIGHIDHDDDWYYAALSDGRVTRFQSYQSANEYLMYWANDLEMLKNQLPDQQADWTDN